MLFPERIVQDPEKCGGKPTIRGLRITVDDVLALMEAGQGDNQILEDFPYLEPDDLKACRLWAAGHNRLP